MTATSTRSRRPATPAPPTPRRAPLLAFGAAGVGVLALLAVVIGAVTRDTDKAPEGTEEVRAVQVTGAALPTDPDGGNDAAVGIAAPVVTGQTFAGEPLTIGGAGQPQLLFFLAHWCSHCQAEVPVVTDWLQDNGFPEGVRLAAVASSTSDGQPNYPPSTWLADEKWPVATLADNSDGSAARAYGLNAFPYFVAIGADGNVVARASGELPIEDIEALVSAARNGTASAVVKD